MDPKETLRLLEVHIDANDYSAAVEALNSYYQWRIKIKDDFDAKADMLGNRLADALEDV